ncbi:MAG: hypothetical protein H0V80_15985 [Acidobacteria bacterium]|nr:hypothetical protein [Acidobacteriota bacterium]
MQRAAAARIGQVAGHAWHVREWMALASRSTTVQPLAYLDVTPRAPLVLARPLGAGRVVLVTALDAWRWRAVSDGYARGWQALAQRLAADVPSPVDVTAWVAGSGGDRVVHVVASLRPDLGAPDAQVSASVHAGGETQPLPLRPAGDGSRRGAMRPLASTGVHHVEVAVRQRGRLVGSGQAVIEVGRARPAAVWADVVRTQALAGALASTEQDVAAAVSRLRPLQEAPAETRWYVTRTWWFAALVLGGLGAEWIARRAARQR